MSTFDTYSVQGSANDQSVWSFAGRRGKMKWSKWGMFTPWQSGKFTERVPSILRNPGKDLDKQRVVEHDHVIYEFERLTTDPDGLLGVLEDTLHECSDEAKFEAKRLLCALFQVQIEDIIYCTFMFFNYHSISTLGFL